VLTAASKIKRVWLARFKVDFRCGHDGLLGESYKANLQPFRGDALVFVGRDRRRIKVLYADENGLWVSYKRFNKGGLKYALKFISDPDYKKITVAELSLLLDGAAYTVHQSKEPYPPDKE
jgi:hypothetical protein